MVALQLPLKCNSQISIYTVVYMFLDGYVMELQESTVMDKQSIFYA